jgi:hypothetical protein
VEIPPASLCVAAGITDHCRKFTFCEKPLLRQHRVNEKDEGGETGSEEAVLIIIKGINLEVHRAPKPVPSIVVNSMQLMRIHGDPGTPNLF